MLSDAVPVSERVVAIVVAYNRRDLLVETLRGLEAQSRPLEAVIVVDNASTDGSADLVANGFPSVELVRLDRNTGGAGGFTVGIERALTTLDADLVWLMDDDTVPDSGALDELLIARRAAPKGAAIFASAVRWTDGRPHPMNTPRIRPFARRSSVAAARRYGCYPVRSASFVSVMIDTEAVLKLGLPVADYFLWNDDFEFTGRLLRHGLGYLCEKSTVEHRTRVFGSTDIDPGPRFFYEVRNKIWLLRFSSALGAGERVLYTGAMLKNWTRTICRSSKRAVLFDGLKRGLKAGLSSRPRSNADVLHGFGDITESLKRSEATR